MVNHEYLIYQLKKTGIYQHFKGNKYVVVDTALDTITNGIVVVYKCHKSHEKYREYEDMCFVRPLTDWFADVSEREDNKTGQKFRMMPVEYWGE